jgi:acyl carrier protein
MTKIELEGRVREIVGRVLDLQPASVRLEADLKDDLGATSLDRYTVLMDMEEAFGLDLSDVPEEILEARILKVEDIVTFLAERLG